MAGLNPNQLLSMLQGGNPQAVATQIIQTQFGNNPFMQSILQMGMKGDVQNLQKIAQQMLDSQGLNVDTELQRLISTLRGN